LETNVIRSYVASPGLEVGYGQTPVPCAGTIVLVALGYGDGIGRRWEGVDLPQKILGHPGKVFGRVNMDVAQIFLAQQTSLAIRPGMPITLWGHDPQDILSISDQLATIPYELTCQLTKRVPRIYALAGSRPR
jgi:alanine racemase